MLFTHNSNAFTISKSIFSYSNIGNDFDFYFTSYFSFGSGPGPRIRWHIISQSNDTMYVRALYDVRGAWSSAFSGSSDTIKHSNLFTGINYLTMTTGVVNSPSGIPENDTTWNVHDSTFYIGTSNIKEQDVAEAMSIFPNPASTAISLPIAANELIVYNTFGQVVLQAHNTKAQQQIVVAQLSNGLYFVAVYDKEKNKVGVGKFYKE